MTLDEIIDSLNFVDGDYRAQAQAKADVKQLFIELIEKDESGCPDHIFKPKLGCPSLICLMSLHANSIKSNLRKKVEDL